MTQITPLCIGTRQRMPNPVLILNGKRIKTLDWKIEKINNLWTGHDSKSNPVREVVSTETYFCCLGKKHKVISMETKTARPEGSLLSFAAATKILNRNEN